MAISTWLWSLGPTLVWNSETDFEIASVVFAVLQQQEVSSRAELWAWTRERSPSCSHPMPLEERFADPTDDPTSWPRGRLLGLMAAFILPQVFGQLTLLSVVEEKSTRVIESSAQLTCGRARCCWARCSDWCAWPWSSLWSWSAGSPARCC